MSRNFLYCDIYHTICALREGRKVSEGMPLLINVELEAKFFALSDKHVINLVIYNMMVFLY